MPTSAQRRPARDRLARGATARLVSRRHMPMARTAIPAHRDVQRGGTPAERFVSQPTPHAVARRPDLSTPPASVISGGDPAGQHRGASLDPLPGHHQPKPIQTGERGRIRASERDSVRHVEVLLLACVRTPIIERPRHHLESSQGHASPRSGIPCVHLTRTRTVVEYPR
jgi:hypothetical protein